MTATSTKPLSELLAQTEFSDDDIVRLLGLTDPEECEALRQRAFDVTTEKTGNNVYLRGLIEVSNICTANCRYCGIRKDNHTVERYTLTEESIVACALHALKEGYGSIAIQAGERRDPKWIAWISRLLERIHKETVCEELPTGLGVTLSLGEQTYEVYKEWAEASGNPTGLRYLLRIESSNPRLFAELHSTPGKHEKILEHRYQALRDLRRAGYQVGTGVMIGLPGQTLEDLMRDIRTFGEALNMISTTRLVMPDINIAAATALETLEPNGRVRGIRHGCNVIMPNITPQTTRASYQLYDNKAGTEVGPESNVLVERNIVEMTGRTLGLNLLGSSRRWAARTA